MKSDSFDRIVNLTATQALLLKACIASTREEREIAVRKWENLVSLDDLAYSSSRLIPYFLYRNQQVGITTKHVNRLKTIYKHWWLRSQHLSHQLNIVHEAISAAGIKSIVTKGASLKLFYERAELRPMADFDLIVRPSDLKKALEIVQELGYVQSIDAVPFTQSHPKLFFDFNHALYCKHPKNNCELDLHWRVGSTCSYEFTNDLWLHLEDYEPISGAKKPQLAYEVFLLLIHAADAENKDNLNWILDIAVILEKGDTSFWHEARKLAVWEKKEDLFDYSCAILIQFGIDAPRPAKVKKPRLLISTTTGSRKEFSRLGLYRVRARNILYRVNRFFPHAGPIAKLYHIGRCLHYYIITKRTQEE